MTLKEFDDACAALPASTMSVQWGGAHVHKVGGKIFAIANLTAGCSFKVSDIAYEAMTESGMARPAPYLARAKWVAFDDLEALDPEEVRGWLANAHALIAAKLTRAVKRELGLG